MGHIFVSYSRRDTEIVDRFVNLLTSSGLDVWIDREDIKVGNTWRVQIVQAIDTCDAFILILSGNSTASDNVRKEIDLAQDAGKKMFVLLLERITIPAELRYQLAGLQFADVPEYGFEASSQGLTRALKEYLASIGPTGKVSRLEVELLIEGVDLTSFNKSKQEELLDFVSKLANVNRSQLQIVNTTVGSVHVFMETPASTAFSLKTMALNHDKRFKEKNISALRLQGNKKFIKTSAGLLSFAAIAQLLRTPWGKFWSSGCGCFTFLFITGVLAWQIAGTPVPPALRTPIITFLSRVPPTSRPPTETKVPPSFVPVTGITVTATPGCFIAVPSTFIYQGPGRAYNIASYQRYDQGTSFQVLMSDRSGDWFYGVLPDKVKGWLDKDWLTSSCISPAIPTASFIAPPPPAGPTVGTPIKHRQ